MIFGPKRGIPVIAANRLQRYPIFLSEYNYQIQFIKGTDNGNADALSRLSLEFPDNANNSELDIYSINLITENIKTISDLDISMEVKKHPLLREVFFRVFTGKWDDIKEVSEDMKPYFYLVALHYCTKLYLKVLCYVNNFFINLSFENDRSAKADVPGIVRNIIIPINT